MHVPTAPRCGADLVRRGRGGLTGPGAALLAVLVSVLLAVMLAVLLSVLSIGPAAAAGPSRSERPLAQLAAAPPGSWHWPVPAPIRVVAPFRAPETPYASGHRGIDVAADPGAVIVAPAAGTVSFAGPVAGRGVVAIDHGDGVVSAIEPVEALAAAGTTVSVGEPIGVVSSGGHCGSACVHFGVRVHGEYVSPFLFLGGLPRAVLLPLR